MDFYAVLWFFCCFMYAKNANNVKATPIQQQQLHVIKPFVSHILPSESRGQRIDLPVFTQAPLKASEQANEWMCVCVHICTYSEYLLALTKQHIKSYLCLVFFTLFFFPSLSISLPPLLSFLHCYYRCGCWLFVCNNISLLRSICARISDIFSRACPTYILYVPACIYVWRKN